MSVSQEQISVFRRTAFLVGRLQVLDVKPDALSI